MPDLTDPNNSYLVLALIVPGLIITYARAQFITGRMQKHTDAILSYFALSMVYSAVALPVLHLSLRSSNTESLNIIGWLVLIFLGPALFGAALGLIAQTEVLRKIASKIGIHPVHVMPTAWDWKFSGMKEQWVIATLQDDTRFAGYCGQNSFMSSDPNERDIYIEKIYDLDEEDNWIDRGENGVLISPGEIKTIEFFPITKGQ